MCCPCSQNKEEDDTGALAGDEASDYESSFIDDTEDVVGEEIEVTAGRETLVILHKNIAPLSYTA